MINKLNPETQTQNAKVYDNTCFVLRENYPTFHEYADAINDYRRHYGYQNKVEGGWIFFEFETDYEIWRNQK